jgi:hypothetical protein
MPDDSADEQPHAHPELDLEPVSSDHPAPTADGPRQLDLLTIGLVVFFVALIGIVAAMLILTTF